MTVSWIIRILKEEMSTYIHSYLGVSDLEMADTRSGRNSVELLTNAAI